MMHFKTLTGAALVVIAAVMALMVTFHLCVMTGLIPYDMVWGGRLESREQMLVFESVSILINLIVLLFAGIKAGIFRWKIKSMVVRVVFWILFGLFILNTLGNLASENDLEKLLFTPATILLAISCLVVALDRS
jgi:hypothetical protein